MPNTINGCSNPPKRIDEEVLLIMECKSKSGNPCIVREGYSGIAQRVQTVKEELDQVQLLCCQDPGNVAALAVEGISVALA